MKKSFIFASLALGLAMVSCDTVDLPNPPGQAYPQDPAFDKNDVEVVADPAAATEVYNLTAFQNENALVPLAIVAKADNVPSGCEMKFSGKLEGSSLEFPCEYVDGMVMVDPDEFNAAVRTISKNPVALNVNVNIYPYIQSTVNAGYVAQIDNVFGPFAIGVLPFEPTTVIEPMYYLLTSVDGTWSAANAIGSMHSDKNVYDDPNFTFVFEMDKDAVEMAGVMWKIVPQSVMEANLEGDYYTASFDDQFMNEGALVVNNPDLGTNISVTGSTVMTVNMEAMTFKYQAGVTQLYTPGSSNGWNAPDSQILTTTDYSNYSGYLYLTGDFKFNPDTSWAGRDFGCNDPFVYEGTPLVGTGVADGSNNINVDEAGVYFCNLNYTTRETKLTQIATMGLIGDATPGGWNESTPMVMTSPLVYTVEVALGDGTFKFRANDGWDINLGGDMFNLTAGGDNIPVPAGAGNYTVTLDLSVYPYTCTAVKK